MAEYKVAVLGGGGVGKSCLTLRFVLGEFVDEYDPTIEDNYRKQKVVDDEPCLFDILDTGGQEEFNQGYWQQYYLKNNEGFLIVYAVDSRSSFNEVEEWHEKVMRAKDNELVPVVVVGNKCDLDDDEREVTPDEAREYVDAHPLCAFFEASAKTGHNVEEAFFASVRQVRNARNPKPQKERKPCGIQ